MDKMKSYKRGGRLGLAVLICANTIADTLAQTAAGPPTSPAEMAKAIAHTINANSPKSMNGPMVFQFATARGNVVEIQYAVKDA